MRRRDFLMGAAAVGAGMAGPMAGAGWARPRQGVDRAKLDRVAIMSLSFSSIIRTPEDPDNPARTLDLMDLPEMYADRYGVHNIELQHTHFWDTEPEYLRALLNSVQRSKSRITQLNAASWGSALGPYFNLSIPGWTRVHLIDVTKRWIDHAVMLGAPRLMIHPAGLGPEVRAMALDTLRKLARYGGSRGVMVTMENSGNNWQEVAALARAAGTLTTPDIGNFPDQETQHRGIRELFTMHSGTAHVKLNPERYDLPAALALTRELGYDGLYSIEASSRVDPDPYVAVQTILDVLMANI